MSTRTRFPAPQTHPLLWPAAALVFAWALVLRAGWWEWSLNAQYSYGMLVPLLSLVLFHRRWMDRPAPQPPGRRGKSAAIAALGTCAVLLAAVQPLVVSNADWRLVPAVAAVSGAGLTLALLYLSGGTPWLRHFAFPVLFFLVAVPWPRAHESAIMSWLMLRNSAFCVEALQWMGYAAEQRGNLIAIPGSLLGVEEACSGIRSLQSNIMVALAAGEFFRLGTGRRLALLLLGLGAAVAGNALRSLTLSVAACRSGPQAVDAIHDTTGLTVLAGSSVLLLLAGWLMSRPVRQEPFAPAAASFPAPDRLLASCARAAALAFIVLGAGAWIGGEIWFRWHESRAPALPTMWTLLPPGAGDNAREVPIAERTLDVLLFPETAYSEQWRDDHGWQWQAFYFHWPPGPTSVQSAFVVHDPRVCLGAAGFMLERELPPWTADANGFTIPFRRYLFTDRGRPVHVFHAVVSDDGVPVDAGGEFGAATRWQNLFQGRRNRGLRVLEFAVRGDLDASEAEARAAAWLNRRIAPDQSAAP